MSFAAPSAASPAQQRVTPGRHSTLYVYLAAAGKWASTVVTGVKYDKAVATG